MSDIDLQNREELSKSVRDKGFRLTPQREKILDIFFDLPEGEHLSAEDLQKKLKQASSDISLATSYRTLKMLASIGVLRELDFAKDHKHYELSLNPGSPHHHIICMDCGGTEEFDSDEVMELARNVLKKRGYELVDVQLKVFAHCPTHEAHNAEHALL